MLTESAENNIFRLAVAIYQFKTNRVLKKVNNLRLEFWLALNFNILIFFNIKKTCS